MMEHHLRRFNSNGSNSLSSQRSLASVPSLNSRSNYPSSQHHCLQSHRGTSYTSSLAVSAKFLFTGSSDSQITSFDLPQQQQPAVAVAGKGAVKSLVLLHHDKLFSAHQDNKIRVWKIAAAAATNSHQQRCTRVATLPTLGDRVSKLLLPNSRVQIRRHKKCTWVHHVDAVSSLAVSHDGALLYSVSWDRTIKVWRTKDLSCLESVAGAHDDAINAVAASRDGRVYTGSADKRIKVWRGLGEKKKKKHKHKHSSLVDSLEKHNSGINALALSSDGSVLYSGACDRSILVWEEGGDQEGKMVVVGALRGHAGSILCLVVVLDLVCSGSEDKTVRLWRSGAVNNDNRREYCCVAVLEGHTGPIKSIAAVVDHCCDQYNTSEEAATSILVYSGSLDCHVKVWQVFVPSLSL